jgi:ATP-dependent RNA helicase DeaD
MQSKESISKILAEFGIVHSMPCRKLLRQTILSNKEILLLSPTGSGKTLAFLLPIAQMLKQDEKESTMPDPHPIKRTGYPDRTGMEKNGNRFKVSCCYGGHDMQTEIQNLAEPPALLIGTPGRIADHIKRATFVRDAVVYIGA